MLLAYLDESSARRAFYVAALVVPDSVAIPLATALQDVVEYTQDTYGGVADTAEFHGYPLWNGEADWQRLSIPGRMDVFQRAVEAIARQPVDIRIRGIEVAGYQRRWGNDPADLHEAALAYVLERVQWSAQDHDDVALVIADEVRGREARYRRSLRHYQQFSTFGWRAQRLDRIADTLHFAPSADSRLLQAADLVAYVHTKSLRPHPDPRVQAFKETLWSTLQPRVREASCWYPSQ